MALSRKISKDLIEEEDVPEEIEHDLIKDSVLEIANTNFRVSDDFEELPVGEIRRNIAEDLSTDYKGKPVSRKAFSQRNWIDDKSDDELDSDEGGIEDDVEEDSDEERNSDAFSDDGESEKSYGEESSGYEKEASEEGSIKSDKESGEERDEDTTKGSKGGVDINIFSSKIKSVGDEIKKGNAIKHQLLLWENMIECRIKLQKALVASNRLFQKESFAQFKSQLTPEEELRLDNAYKGLTDLLENFIKLRECLLNKCPEYTNFKKDSKSTSSEGSSSGKVKNENDDEITSESENEKEENSEDEQIVSEGESPPLKKLKTHDDYSEYLSSTTLQYKPFRDTVIQKWNDKTRLASGKIGISKFAILEQSTLKQIEQILLDKERLLKRTQTRRSKLPVLGKERRLEGMENNEEDEENGTHDNKPADDETLDCEIFDDDDFYHKLLKDFIDRKTSDVTDPTQLGRQWTKLQKLRSKMKRKVDTRATKGRKIRYTVHNKLVNFMAPIPYSTWDDKVEQDLFRSLFGQASQAPLKVNSADQ